jgi:hypothetical protein
MKRRSLLRVGLAMGSATLLTGHMPYRQWYPLVAKHWLIAASRDDAEATRLANAASMLLAARVSQSRAMAVEAENERDVVQLLRTHQLELGIVSIDAANDALAGSGAYRDRPVALRTVAPFGPHLLVALEDYATDKAARIAAALAGFRWPDGSAPTRRSGPQSKVPLHSGAIRFKQARETGTGQ